MRRSLTFTVCDKHLLAYPKAPASPYGADGLLPRIGFSILLPLALGVALILGGSSLVGVRRRHG